MRDEEHDDGARITLEEDGEAAPWSITCGVYGWMVHTRFFSRRTDADSAFDLMKPDLDRILQEAKRIGGNHDDAGFRRVSELCSGFVERFPV